MTVVDAAGKVPVVVEAVSVVVAASLVACQSWFRVSPDVQSQVPAAAAAAVTVPQAPSGMVVGDPLASVGPHQPRPGPPRRRLWHPPHWRTSVPLSFSV